VSRPVNFEQLLQYATLKRSDLAPRAARRSSRRSKTINSPDPAIIAEVQRRFAICKVCNHASDDGFACKLYTGCCFGRFRAVSSNHCPDKRW